MEDVLSSADYDGLKPGAMVVLSLGRRGGCSASEDLFELEYIPLKSHCGVSREGTKGEMLAISMT